MKKRPAVASRQSEPSEPLPLLNDDVLAQNPDDDDDNGGSAAASSKGKTRAATAKRRKAAAEERSAKYQHLIDEAGDAATSAGPRVVGFSA